MEEIDDVVTRPKVLRNYQLSRIEIDEFRFRPRVLARISDPTQPLPIQLRDPKDDYVLATAIEGNANVLIGGDKDFLVIAGDNRLGGLRILSPAEFLSMKDLGHRRARRFDRLYGLADPCLSSGAEDGTKGAARQIDSRSNPVLPNRRTNG